MSINRWMNKEAVLHIYNGILLSHKKEHIWGSSNEVDEPRAYYTKWSKSEKEKQMSCIMHIYGITQLCLTVTPWTCGRLLCPWDSPGKNTGVGCHSLSPEDLPNPGMEPVFPVLQADSLSHQGNPIYGIWKDDTDEPSCRAAMAMQT